MQIIVVSGRMVTARTITLTARHAAAAVAGLIGLVVVLSSFVSFLALHKLPEVRLPFVQNLVLGTRAEEMQKSQEFVRENLNAMAVRLGEMQARIMRLDSLGERLSGLVGIKPAEFVAADKPGQGGPLILPTRSLSATELQQQLDALSRQVDSRSDYLGMVESQLLEERVRKNRLPTTLPIETGWDSSSFGYRADPFTGESALHAGVDFTAPPGTPIVAAAGGVVAAAEYHPAYGHYVDIDHGDDVVTRYAHAKRLLVKSGMVVKPGQTIAEVGSSGRSTGPHLHFEVRVNDIPQNPNRFLLAARNQRQSVAASR